MFYATCGTKIETLIDFQAGLHKLHGPFCLFFGALTDVITFIEGTRRMIPERDRFLWGDDHGYVEIVNFTKRYPKS